MSTDSNGVDWDALGYVAASDYRCAVVAALDVDGPATPTTIGDRTDLEITHVSRTLTELRDRDVVELLVPEERKKGRIYGLTDGGQRLADETDEVNA
ncbi:MarR family winged helix-turn-helix transcriptional regulator [Halobacterium bonnevillei]|uniref:Helix-turn-helix domain-containing protein n=1 Tax=Halobacterium bonnevillei TaxID=2692200 RepID=A0A6B0SF02_9EURY|nr:MarR family winged helix-turn-helix transcriptional regulator [Halobacterium bonnevillei]MXR20334.1 helix-turn-helix domain-containing protein [Halobacterium bonnevillei]